ncbi:alpha/beta fold hydrolase [Arenicella xantha]|uniref:Pimeloyl-ACP methyl ester carboxylesterase n=1 Tax=Arenicella xantha TaxID=644221 RepID=A0A395JH34_9GAMM|nr:alpha/beta fold hydrolase [Arenicella xantha]RBP49226.1 pimeloyl-ACP methyl ester carboxylesterase [Arenicella xantha]
MDNSRFSTLVYRIIGKPERWHEDYIDIMHQVLDETESFDDPANFSELEIGDQILRRLSDTNEALVAFGTLLDKSRFKMIILDNDFVPIYFNQNAEDLHTQVLSSVQPGKLDLHVLNLAQNAAEQNIRNYKVGNRSNLTSLENLHCNGDQVYLRSIHNQTSPDAEPIRFYLLLVLDQSRNDKQLNPDFIKQHELTDKEQMVLVKLMHGKTIKEIACESFISENTVKTHLKSLYRKTYTKSQADIVRLVLTHESQILDSYFGTGGGLFMPDSEKTKDRFLNLASGYQVAYRDYGPADGDVVIMLHNGYGCRVTIPLGYEEILVKLNKRVIIPDRPGYGRSEYIKNHPKGWEALINEFIDALDIKQYDLLGSVFGSVMALCFATQADHRLKQIRLCSPVFVNQQSDTQFLTGILSPTSRLVRASKRFAKEIYQLWLKSIAMNLDVHYRSMLESSIGSAERELFQKNQTLDLMIEGFREGSSQSLEGISSEMVYCLSPRKIDLSSITVPVTMWWGTEDIRVSQDGVEHLAKQLPNVELRILEGYSEHLYYALFEEILTD